jgi:RNA polymerase sigma-70 factor, ECF subfamily
MEKSSQPKSLGRVVPIDTGPTDADLVSAVLSGSRLAKEQLFRRHVHRIGRLIARLLGHDDDLEDLVQDTFVAAFASLPSLRQPQMLSSWLASIATRQVTALLRRRKMLRRLGIARSDPIDIDSLLSPSAPQDIAAELKLLYAAVERLPTSERIVLILRRVEQLEFNDVAMITGLSLATVKRRLACAERMIRSGDAENGGVP